MIPRGRPDISWAELAYALARCLLPDAPARAQARAEAAWREGETLACLSVRGGFDLALQALGLPAGSELLVSAVNIRDMARIAEHHGLVCVPIDIEPATLAPGPALERALSPRTRGLLVAHLFGARLPIEPLAHFARRHGLLLFEDCAQAYAADGYRGHPASDVSMFSFGPIKTHTALGGALLRFRDPALLERARALQARYPVRSRTSFARRALLFAALKLLAHPLALGPFVALCRLAGSEADALVTGALRGFRGDLIAAIRRRPCAPQLRLLARRVARPRPQVIAQRVRLAARLWEAAPGLAVPGERAAAHSHWVLPVLADDPERLTALLRALGYDATRAASQLAVLPPPASRPSAEAAHAAHMMAHIVYLPVYPRMRDRDLARLARVLREAACVEA
jgi:perosamine synthetase